MESPDATALVVLAPAVDPWVGAFRKVLDPSAKDGVPAHVTVLFPFAPLAELDAAAQARLRAAFARFRPFTAHFRRIGSFTPRDVHLVPEPTGVFADLTRAVVEAFPAYPPYGGAHAEIVPHLTVAHDADPQHVQVFAECAPGRLEASQTVFEVFLFARDQGRWRERLRIPLGG